MEVIGDRQRSNFSGVGAKNSLMGLGSRGKGRGCKRNRGHGKLLEIHCEGAQRNGAVVPR